MPKGVLFHDADVKSMMVRAIHLTSSGVFIRDESSGDSWEISSAAALGSPLVFPGYALFPRFKCDCSGRPPLHIFCRFKQNLLCSRSSSIVLCCLVYKIHQFVEAVMSRLSEPIRSDLALSDFKLYSVWTFGDDNESYLPVLGGTIQDMEDWPLFIKANFVVCNVSLDGYLVGSEYYYAFILFCEDEGYPFNRSSMEISKRSRDQICRLIGSDPADFFPIQ